MVYCVADCGVVSCSGLVAFCLPGLLLDCGALCLLIVFVLLFSGGCVVQFVLLFMSTGGLICYVLDCLI